MSGVDGAGCRDSDLACQLEMHPVGTTCFVIAAGRFADVIANTAVKTGLGNVARACYDEFETLMGHFPQHLRASTEETLHNARSHVDRIRALGCNRIEAR